MRMYYHSFDAGKRKWVVGLASSRDGFDWTKRGPVFEGGQGSDFDAHGAAVHNVVKDVDSKRCAPWSPHALSAHYSHQPRYLRSEGKCA